MAIIATALKAAYAFLWLVMFGNKSFKDAWRSQRKRVIVFFFSFAITGIFIVNGVNALRHWVSTIPPKPGSDMDAKATSQSTVKQAAATPPVVTHHKTAPKPDTSATESDHYTRRDEDRHSKLLQELEEIRRLDDKH